MAQSEQSLWNAGYRPSLEWAALVDEAGNDSNRMTVLCHITKPDGTRYTVNVAEGVCNCPGFVYHRKCRHTSGLLQLLIDQAAEYAEQRRLLTIRCTPAEKQISHFAGSPAVNPAVNAVFRQMKLLEALNWQLLSVAANLKGHDWAIPARFVSEEEAT